MKTTAPPALHPHAPLGDRPDDAAALMEHGHALRALGRLDEATAFIEQAAALSPSGHANRLVLLLHRGTALEAAGDAPAALKQFEQATVDFPDSADAWAVLGLAQSQQLDPSIAQVSLARALALDPDRPDVMDRLARVLIDQKAHESAAIVYERLMRLQPDRPLLRGWLLHCKYLMGDWLNLERLHAEVEATLQAGQPAAEPFGLQGWCDNPAWLRQAAEHHMAGRAPSSPGLLSPPVIGRTPRLRIGYVAGEFREQATSVLLTEVLERHDRTRFEVHAFDNGWDDGSPRRRRIEAACRVHPIRGLGDLAAARLVRRHAIDILVDLNGHFGLPRHGLFALRAAPIQVNYLGFPGTVGADWMDYLVADRQVLPASDHAHVLEQVVWLPHCYQPNDTTRVPAERPANRAECGLPDGAFVFCCFNNPYKILPAVFEVWMRLLVHLPHAVLLLLGDSEVLQANLRHEAALRSVAPDRLLFAASWPHAHHLRRMALCDLFLDTWPYNAHTTGSDALWAGLPVLTCTGRSFASRVGASLLRAAGLPELVTSEPAAYEALALKLAREPALLAGLRSRLASRHHDAPLFDMAGYTRALETAWQTMADRARAGLPPRHFAVDA